MRMNLSLDPKVRYSPGEQRLFALLNQKPIPSTVLAGKYYRGDVGVPYHSRKIVIGLADSLRKKVIINREPFRVIKSNRKGPHPIEIWLELTRGGENGKRKA